MKLNRFKNTFFTACLGGAMALTGCTDLSETVFSEIPGDGSYTFTEQDIQAQYGGIYANLRDMYNGWESYQDISEECGDLIMTPFRYETSGWGVQYVSLHQHRYHARVAHLWRPWYACYQGINTCNQLLDNETIAAIPQSKAELRTYRALFYYVLFDLYRNIPLQTTLNVPADYVPEQEDPKKMFDFIVTELEESKDDLPTDKKFGQINRYGACMLLAKMYLNRNAWFPKEAEDMTFYQKAYKEADEVIQKGGYTLASNYLNPFKADSYDAEVIFALVYDKKYAGHGTNYFNKWYCAGADKIFDVKGAGWNGSACVPQFLDTYDEADTRKTDTWRWGPQQDKQGNDIYLDGKLLDLTPEVYAIEKPGASTMQGARLQKYEIVAGDVTISNDDVPFFRLSDAYFIKAECLLRLGGYNGETEQTAADLVTEVRKRAFKNHPEKAVRTVEQLKGGSCYDYGLRETQGTIAADGSFVPDENYKQTFEGGADIVLGGLLDDLAWEFVYEHHRRQDLIRFKMTNGANVFNGKSWFGKSAIADPSEHTPDVYPIHQDYLDANLKLIQNPIYEYPNN